MEKSSSNVSFPIGIHANVKYHPPHSIDMFRKKIPRPETFLLNYSSTTDGVEILEMMGSYQWQKGSFPRYQF